MLKFLQSLLKKTSVKESAVPESHKQAVKKDIQHLLSLYTCHFFTLLPQGQPYQSYKPTRTNPDGGLGV